MPSHDDLRSRGRVQHWRIDNAIDASGKGYCVDDLLALESNLSAPAVGTAPSKVAYKTNFALYEFPDNVTRYLQSAVQLPHSYVNGSPLLWHVHFINEAQLTNGQTVTFTAEVTSASVGGVFGNAVSYSTTYTASGTVPADTHCISQSVEIPATTLNGSAFVLARISRTTTDTATTSVLLLGSDYHIRKSRIGSASESPV